MVIPFGMVGNIAHSRSVVFRVAQRQNWCIFSKTAALTRLLLSFDLSLPASCRLQ